MFLHSLTPPTFVLFLYLWSCPAANSHDNSIAAQTKILPRYEHRTVVLDENKHDEEFFSFVTRPDLDAPRWSIEVYDEEAVSPGYWFVTPYEEVSQEHASRPWNAPHIYDSRGELIWSGAPIFNGFSVFDFRVSNVLGRDMLSLIHEHEGRAVIIDDSYNIYHQMHFGSHHLTMNEPKMNMHEFTTVDNGTRALHLFRMPKKASRKNSRVVGYDGECYVDYNGFREMDTETWETVFEWDSEGHIGLDESFVTQDPIDQRCGDPDKPWDFFHANSIDKFPDGDYLVSSRRTNTIYKVSHIDGAILWRLGGRKSDFQLPITFSGQHAAKIQGYNDTHTLTSFLDNAFGPGDPQITNEASRGLLLALDTKAMTTEVVVQFKHPNGEGEYAKGKGNLQMLPNGHAWFCWTAQGLQSEHTANGTLIMKAEFKASITNYRSFKMPWIGRPNQLPDVRAAAVVKDKATYTIVHMSWNGATEVKEWKVYHTNAYGDDRTLAAKSLRSGFETAVWTEGYATHVLVEAIDKAGNKLGQSYVFATIPTHDELSSVSSHSGSWLRSASRNPFVTFFCGIFACIFAGSVVWGIRLSTQRQNFVWRRQKKETYKSFFEGDEDDINTDDEAETVGAQIPDASIALLAGKG